MKASKAPTGRLYASPTQRPGLSIGNQPALKGRPKPCLSPLRASTSISFSAPRIASESFLTGFATRSMLTWPPCCRTLAVLPCSSIPSKTTFTSSLNWPAPSLSAQPWKMLKRRLPNGSRRRAVNSPDSPGRQVMERLRCPNPTCPPYGNTSRTSRNIIGKNRFRRNTGRFWSDIGSPSMNGMFGIDATGWFAPSGPRALPWAGMALPRWGARRSFIQARTGRPTDRPRGWPALSGLDSFSISNPGRCPGLVWICPVGTQEGTASRAPTGRYHYSPGQRPGSTATPPIPAPTGRPNARHRVCPAPSGLNPFSMAYPGRCPGLAWNCPVGAQERGISKAPTERPYRSVWAFYPTFPKCDAMRHELDSSPKAPTERPYRNVWGFYPTSPNWNALRSELRFSKAPTGRHHPSLGQRPRFLTTPPIPAPTGRPNRNGGAA